jgi:hypothetical protein
MPPYNGHRSWNAWNVALWIDNDEGLYTFALDCLKRSRSLERAVTLFLREYDGQRTPDGGRFNRACVREALRGLND